MSHPKLNSVILWSRSQTDKGSIAAGIISIGNTNSKSGLLIPHPHIGFGSINHAREQGVPPKPTHYKNRALTKHQNPALQQSSHLTTELLHHLHHVATFLGAGAARLGAGGHVFVIGKLLAGGSTLVATFGATLRRSGGKLALPCAQRRAHFAALRAVHTKMHAPGMLFFAVTHEGCAVMEARIALNLAIGTGGCALQHMGRVRTVFRCLAREHGRACDEESQSHRTQ